MQVVDVDALDAEIPQATSQLIFKKFRRHAMTSCRNVIRGENSGLNVFAEKIFVRVGRHGSIWSQVAAFGAHHDFFAFESAPRELLDGCAKAALAALKPVIDGGVH